MPRPLATAASLALALTLAACGGGTDDEPAAQAGSPAPSVTASPAETPSPTPAPTKDGGSVDDDAAGDTPDAEPVAVPKQLDFTVQTVDGQRFEGASLAGQDAVLYFWAPWCPVCAREAPLLNDVARDVQGVTVVGVAGLSDDVASMETFVANTGTGGLTHLADTDGAIYAGFGITAQTTFAFVNDDGTVEVVPGPLSLDEVTERATALVEG
jgi:peroxiredoxin